MQTGMQWIKQMSAGVLAGMLGANAAAEETGAVSTLKEVVVAVTRTPQSITAVPGSVSVIERAEIEAQTALTPTRDLAEILSKLVPGLAQASQSLDSFGQTLRGRSALLLIDGVPQSVNPSNFRDFLRIDPAAIERIEIIRGASAIYGEGATGGIINIVTRKPVAGGPRYSTEFGGNFSTSHPQGSFGGNLSQYLSGKNDSFDYVLSAAVARIGGLFDAQGDRTMPGSDDIGSFADSNLGNVLGKLGWDIGRQRLQFSVNHYRLQQRTGFTPDPAVNNIPERVKARYLSGLELDSQSRLENTSTSLDYSHPEFFGSRLYGQLYYLNHLSISPPVDGRPATGLREQDLHSDKVGGRLQMATPLPGGGAPQLLWGLDFSNEKQTRKFTYFDGAVFDASGGRIFQPVSQRTVLGTLEQSNLGLFAQLELKPHERWQLRGGVRHEQIQAEVDSFVNRRGNSIEGGRLTYHATVFNAGAIFDATDTVNLFANYSQGFSAPNLNAALSNAAAGTAVESLRPEPQKVDHYELGARAEWGRIQTSLAAFYSTSKLGTSIVPLTGLSRRAPERIYGAEATVDALLARDWRIGGTASWIEGKEDVNNNGHFTPLPSFRIPPLKLTAYLEHETLPRLSWRNRLQVLYSGARRRAFESGADPFPVESYAIVDYLGSLKAGIGTLRFGIENLFNKQYFTPYFQVWEDNKGHAAARGRVASIGYVLNY